MAIACRALLLHAFYPFTQNKINSKFFSCWTVKTEKTCIYMSAKIYLRRTKLIHPFLLISFTFNLVAEHKFMQIYRSLQSFSCINQRQKGFVGTWGSYLHALFERVENLLNATMSISTEMLLMIYVRYMIYKLICDQHVLSIVYNEHTSVMLDYFEMSFKDIQIIFVFKCSLNAIF